MSKKQGKKKEIPLQVKGSFEDLIKISVAGNPAPKPKASKTKIMGRMDYENLVGRIKKAIDVHGKDNIERFEINEDFQTRIIGFDKRDVDGEMIEGILVIVNKEPSAKEFTRIIKPTK